MPARGVVADVTWNERIGCKGRELFRESVKVAFTALTSANQDGLPKNALSEHNRMLSQPVGPWRIRVRVYHLDVPGCTGPSSIRA